MDCNLLILTRYTIAKTKEAIDTPIPIKDKIIVKGRIIFSMTTSPFYTRLFL